MVFMTSLVLSANEIVIDDKSATEVNFATREHDPVVDVRATKVSDDEVEVIWSWSEMLLIEDFETGNLNSFSWNNKISYPWEITTDSYEGTYGIKSTNVGVNLSSSAIEVTVDVPKDGAISFFMKMSSEQGFDKGYFYIDGQYMGDYSGNLDRAKKEYKITEGEHTFRWEYTKDQSNSSGEDCMYLYCINFTDEPTVLDPGLLYYDDGFVVNNVGNGDNPIYWGVMFPTSMLSTHDGESLTKVLVHGNTSTVSGMEYSTEGSYTLNIYFGGETSPGILIHTQDFTMMGEKQWHEIELISPLPLDVT